MSQIHSRKGCYYGDLIVLHTISHLNIFMDFSFLLIDFSKKIDERDYI